MMRNLDLYQVDAILVTHGHGDHAADAKELARKTKAKVIGQSQYIASLRLPKSQQLGGHRGDAFVIGDVSVHLVPAVHDSEMGHEPLGFVIRFADGRTLYHSGDTSTFESMSEIQKIYQPDIILMQAGGGPYNQDPAMAAYAINTYFKPSAIIPMHYGTWPVLSDEDDVRKAFEGDERLHMTKPGETITF
jgi:L-ascorbate metabolism protein UlaG (beta-lactamase superfamily)